MSNLLFRDKLQNEILEKLARKHNIPKSKVREAAGHQSKFTSEIIKSGTYGSVRWPGFGVFKPAPKAYKYDLKKRGPKAPENE